MHRDDKRLALQGFTAPIEYFDQKMEIKKGDMVILYRPAVKYVWFVKVPAWDICIEGNMPHDIAGFATITEKQLSKLTTGYYANTSSCYTDASLTGMPSVYIKDEYS